MVCRKGAVLAALHFEVINKSSSTGHSTVLRLIENAEMSAAVAKIAQRLGLSGMNGFDFILEAETGNPHLIEINARATQVGHLTLGPTRDLPATLFASVTGEPVHESSTLTDNAVIALFPQEWRRDPSSLYLCSGYHDVPWNEPELLRVRRSSSETMDMVRGEGNTARSSSRAGPAVLNDGTALVRSVGQSAATGEDIRTGALGSTFC